VPARTLMAAAALAAAVAVYAAVRRERVLRHQLARERAAARLTAGAMGRDLLAFRSRIEAAGLQRAVMQEADRVLSEALAVHTTYADPSEGGLG